MAQIPDKLTDFRVFNDAQDLIGVVDVDLPDLEADTEELRGAGIAGTIETPALGQLKSLTVGLSFRTMTDSSHKLLAPKAHKLTLYGSLQFFDGASGENAEKQCKIYVQAIPKKKSLGKFDSGKQTETKMELEATYLKLTLDGEDRIEIDKLNYIYAIDGTDYLADVRTNLGLG